MAIFHRLILSLSSLFYVAIPLLALSVVTVSQGLSMFHSFWFSLVYSWVKMSLLPHRITELQILKEFHLTHLLIVKHERPEAPTGKRFAPGLEFSHRCLFTDWMGYYVLPSLF